MSNTPNLRFHRRRCKLRQHLKEIRKENRRSVPDSINSCWKPSAPQTKADLADLHDDDMRERRKRQLGRTGWPIEWLRGSGKNRDAAYRKSIWPAAKVERRRLHAAPD
jgi:hypothetical protein